MQSGASSSTEEDGLVEFGNPKNTKSSTRNTIISTGLIVLLGVALTLVLVYFLIFAEKENTIDYVDGSSLSSWEKMLLDEVSSCRLRCGISSLSSVEHVAGTVGNEYTTDTLETAWQEAGLDVEREMYDVLLSYPTATRSVSLLADPDMQYNSFDCSLKEEGFKDDPSSLEATTPTFLAYSGNGTTQGALVYVNYGREEDFVELENRGISVEGKIVLVRYGGVLRGNKVQGAELRKAVGVLIYSDPIDVGYGRGDIYPQGPWRPWSGVERGSIFTGAGDPTTPGFPSSASAPRLTSEQIHDPDNPAHLSNIPAISISYGDAEPLLNALSFSSPCITPEGWTGGLNLTYCTGPGSAIVEMSIEMEEKITPIINLIAKIEGKEESDRIVLVGAHRDAWSYGASDPISGATTIAEVGRVFGSLLQKGWQPRRTIWLCSWDAEEYMKIGSTEFVERHEQLLLSRAVTYINLDSTSGGPTLYLDGMPSLSDFYRELTSLLPSPSSSEFCSRFSSSSSKHDICCYCGNPEYDPARQCTSSVFDSFDGECLSSPPSPLPENPYVDNSLADNFTTLEEHWSLYLSYNNMTFENVTMPTCTGDIGGGSDQASFVAHLGIPASYLRYVDTEVKRRGSYHSIYDDFRFMEKFIDPGYQYFRSLTQLLGVATLRFASQTVLHFTFSDYATLLQQAATSLEQTYNGVNFATLVTAVDNLVQAAEVMDNTRHRVVELLKKGKKKTSSCFLSDLLLRSLNDRLMLAERSLLFLQRTDSRAWFRHTVWQSSQLDGYSTAAFSFISDALKAGDMEEAQFRVQLVALYVDQMASNLNFSIC